MVLASAVPRGSAEDDGELPSLGVQLLGESPLATGGNSVVYANPSGSRSRSYLTIICVLTLLMGVLVARPVGADTGEPPPAVIHGFLYGNALLIGGGGHTFIDEAHVAIFESDYAGGGLLWEATLPTSFEGEAFYENLNERLRSFSEVPIRCHYLSSRCTSAA